MEASLRNKVGLEITTFEVDEYGEQSPILTHTFWGADLKQALEYAKAHLISDHFFYSCFYGSMKWNDNELILTNESRIVSISYRYTYNDIEESVKAIKDHLRVSNSDTEVRDIRLSISDLVNEMSKII